METRQIVKIGLGAAFLWYGILRGARALMVGVRDFSFRGVNVSEGTVSLNLNLLIKNPLLVGLKLKGVTGDVYAQGQKVGYINTTIDYYLSGGHTHVVPVVVNLNVAGLGQAAILNIQSGDIRTLTITFAGKIYVGSHNIGVPVDITLNYEDLVQ
ncbi:MAG: hypothetical protein J5659_03345 [Clostridia bacterium]|nr:hypothetical protein [Clostridia bacterium]